MTHLVKIDGKPIEKFYINGRLIIMNYVDNRLCITAQHESLIAEPGTKTWVTCDARLVPATLKLLAEHGYDEAEFILEQLKAESIRKLKVIKPKEFHDD
jgi:hypothetical protein